MGLDRAFLQMLTAPVVLERHVGKDQWGNETYGAPEDHVSFINEGSARLGADDGQGKQESSVTYSASLMMDAVGVKPKDRILYNGTYKYVTEVETAKDEFGADLFQTVTVQNEKKG